MLQTCTRCRSRRIKCDSLLPACANCARNDLECTFRDDALQEDIPRSYIKSLEDRIHELNSQLALHSQSSIPSGQHNGISPFSTDSSHKPLHVLIPGPKKDLHLDLSSPSRITRVAFEVLLQSQELLETPEFPDAEPLVPDLLQFDRSLITPSIVRHLLARYDRYIRPRYHALALETSNYDGANLKKVPTNEKFKILMACAIAAACESYKVPSWKSIAHICREWVNEYTTTILLAADRESLMAIILLLIYELADPSRGATWELLDLAVRTCLQLGWHRTAHIQQASPNSIDDENATDLISPGPNDIQLMSVLKDIEWSLRTIFNRPNMLSGFKLPTASDSESILFTHMRLFHELYNTDQDYENESCPFTGEVSLLMETVEGFQNQDPMVLEIWLLFLSVCVRHKQCVFCFQEADDINGKGMKSLRHRVVVAASQLISSVYETAIARDGFIPPLIASSRAFISGCAITTAIAKKWSAPQSHIKDLSRCTEILTLFAPHWKGGHGYLEIWRKIIGILDTNQT